jgi:hypothetical protein
LISQPIFVSKTKNGGNIAKIGRFSQAAKLPPGRDGRDDRSEVAV